MKSLNCRFKEQDKKMQGAMTTAVNREYHLLKDNCAQACIEALNAVGLTDLSRFIIPASVMNAIISSNPNGKIIYRKK